MRRIMLCSVALASSLLLGADARAADSWSDPYTGIRHLYRTASGPLRMHLLVVDLCAPGISVRATKSSERQRTASSFGSLTGTEAVINGDFFSYTDYSTSGLSIGDGNRWTDTADSTSSGFVAFGTGQAEYSAPSESVGTPPAWMENVVSGHPQIVKDGQAIHISNCTSHYCERHPRTAVGFSKNRRTMYMLVVDGRSTVSIGVNLSDLGDLMEGFGAWDALNFDGGGSTTMWLKSAGVVNAPSDGAQRVVANHLGLQAGGGGMPGSCAEDPLEAVLLDSHLFDAAATTDVDGDGLTDWCARAAAGFRCHLSTGTGLGTTITGPELSDATGWDDEDNYATLRMADINGDLRADVCARANAGIRCYPSTGSGFGPAITGPAWADADGWSELKSFSTIRMADVDGDGNADICGRLPTGMQCHLSTGTGFGPALDGPTMSDASGWGAVSHYGTMRMGDITGDGKADICARAAKGMVCWPSVNGSFPSSFDGPVWSNAAGWDAMKYWSTIRLLDIDGDGRLDLCGRGPTGVDCHLSTGTGFGPKLDGPGLADSQGWADQTNYLTLRAGDVNGDGKADLCARANAGIRCWPSTGSGFGAAIVGPDLSDTDGWFQEKYFDTLRLADINGDERADICARAAAGYQCWASDGNGFPTQVTGPTWSDSSGWGKRPYWSTIRVAGPIPPPPPPDAGPDATESDSSVSPDSSVAPDSAADSGTPQEDSAVASDSPLDSSASESGDPWPAADAGALTDGAPSAIPPDGGENAGGCACAQHERVRSPWWATLALALLATLAARRKTRRA